MAPCCCAASSSRTCRARTPSCSTRPPARPRRGAAPSCPALATRGDARDMGFAMVALPAIVGQATQGEHREMEDFAVWALSRTLSGIFPLAVYQEMGFSTSDLEEIKRYRRERAAGGDETAFRKYFRRDLHGGLVRNLRKVGLLTARIAPNLHSFGISLAA